MNIAQTSAGSSAMTSRTQNGFATGQSSPKGTDFGDVLANRAPVQQESARTDARASESRRDSVDATPTSDAVATVPAVSAPDPRALPAEPAADAVSGPEVPSAKGDGTAPTRNADATSRAEKPMANGDGASIIRDAETPVAGATLVGTRGGAATTAGDASALAKLETETTGNPAREAATIAVTETTEVTRKTATGEAASVLSAREVIRDTARGSARDAGTAFAAERSGDARAAPAASARPDHPAGESGQAKLAETLPRALSERVLAALQAGSDKAGDKPAAAAMPRAFAALLKTGSGGREGADTAAAIFAGPSAVSAGAPSALALAATASPLPSQQPQVLAEMATRALVEAARDGNWRVSLQLDPQDLGPLEVRLSREQGAITAHFVAATPGARAALEQALPMLQQQLGAAGLQFGGADVSQQQAHARAGAAASSAASGAQIADDGQPEPLVIQGDTARRGSGLFEGWA